jgi:hypothetical protein
MSLACASSLALTDIAGFQILRPHFVPELAIWSDAGDTLVAGRADAVSVTDGRIDVVIDWKSDIDLSPSVRADYRRQLQEYMSAVQADLGALMFMSWDEVVLIGRPDTSERRSPRSRERAKDAKRIDDLLEPVFAARYAERDGQAAMIPETRSA